MTSELDFMKLCRLCLIKDGVKVPIFGNTNEVEQLFSKISSCLPVKVSQDDKLPKKICEPCLQKVDSLYQFWNTAANAEKQLLQWLEKVNVNMNAEENSSTQIDKPQEHSTTTNVVCKQECDAEIQDDSDSFQDNGFQVFDASYSPQPNTSTMTTNILRQRLLTSKSDTSSNSEEKNAKKTKEVQNNDSDDEMLGNRVAKQEVNSDEDYEESDQMLQPTAFVDVPCDADQPGPSGLNKTTAESGSPLNHSASKNQEGKSISLYDELKTKLKDLAIETMTEKTEPKLETSKMLERLNKQGLTIKKVTENDDIEQELIEIFDSESEYEIEALDDDIEVLAPLHKFLRKTNPDISNILTEKCLNRSPSYLEKKLQMETENMKTLEEEFLHSDVVDDNKCNIEQKNEFIKVKRTNYLCMKCGTIFNTLEDLEQHNLNTVPCPTLVYPCKLCKKVFTQRGKLNVHVKLHANCQHLLCKKCGKKLANKISYRLHIQSSHTQHFDQVQNGYKCKYCLEIFQTKRQIIRHVNQNHHHITTYLCEICGKKFYQKSGFQRHIWTHRETKAYLCQICSKGFKMKSSLNLHLKTHSSERSYICDECGKSFKKGFSLKEHKKVHAGDLNYVCDICQKRFVSRTNLNSHLRNHS